MILLVRCGVFWVCILFVLSFMSVRVVSVVVVVCRFVRWFDNVRDVKVFIIKRFNVVIRNYVVRFSVVFFLNFLMVMLVG